MIWRCPNLQVVLQQNKWNVVNMINYLSIKILPSHTLVAFMTGTVVIHYTGITRFINKKSSNKLFVYIVKISLSFFDCPMIIDHTINSSFICYITLW